MMVAAPPWWLTAWSSDSPRSTPGLPRSTGCTSRWSTEAPGSLALPPGLTHVPTGEKRRERHAAAPQRASRPQEQRGVPGVTPRAGEPAQGGRPLTIRVPPPRAALSRPRSRATLPAGALQPPAAGPGSGSGGGGGSRAGQGRGAARWSRGRLAFPTMASGATEGDGPACAAPTSGPAPARMAAALQRAGCVGCDSRGATCGG